jgi:hypothetical protein
MNDERRAEVVVAAVSPGLNQPIEAAIGALRDADTDLGQAFAPVLSDQPESSEAARAFASNGKAPLGSDQEDALVRACVDRWPDRQMRLAFMRRGLRDRWFSHWHDRHQTAVISLHDWENISRLPITAFVAYELVFFGLRTLSDTYEPRDLLHAETHGCLFDFCEEKSAIEFKLRTGDICRQCREGLMRVHVPVERVLKTLEVVRSLAMDR